ncbi:hypothetical protein [Streptomyces sp. NPDC003077]|uniref:hypothetical protein n=1 Tax=Streptomyces sp. NPDC003077 TaxID=3154443 RepID=UPI0033A24C00
MSGKKIWPYWGLVVFVFAITAWLTSDVGPAGLAGLFGLSCLWFLLQAPIPCGAPIRAAGRSCRNNARGVLRGCHLEQHKWQRARGLFVRPSWRRACGALFATPVTGLTSLGGIVTLVSTVLNIVLSVLGKGGGG